MDPFKRSPLHGGVFALALTAAALLLSLIFRPLIEPSYFLIFIAAVWLSAWQYGRTAGFIAGAGSAIALLFFFLRAEAASPLWNVAGRLLAFLVMCALITWLTASSRDS